MYDTQHPQLQRKSTDTNHEDTPTDRELIADGGTPMCGDQAIADQYESAHGSLLVNLREIGQEYRDTIVRSEIHERRGTVAEVDDSLEGQLEAAIAVELAATIAIPPMFRVSDPEGAPFDLIYYPQNQPRLGEAKGFRHPRPDLWVPTRQPLSADIYICGRYDDDSELVELVGWATREQVADAPKVWESWMKTRNRVIDFDDLLDITELLD